MGHFHGSRQGIVGNLRRAAQLAALGAAAASLLACNGITGSDDLVVSGGTSGGGGNPSGGGGGKPPVECAYPTEGYALDVGGVITPNKFEGYPADSEELGLVSVADYYDCDGSKGNNALLILVSATWCGACQQEASILNSTIATTYDPAGIRVMTLMIEDQDTSPAKPSTALAWKQQFGLNTTVAADPGGAYMTISKNSTIGLPLSVAIDTRTMQIVDVQEGYPFDDSKLMETAAKNAE